MIFNSNGILLRRAVVLSQRSWSPQVWAISGPATSVLAASRCSFHTSLTRSASTSEKPILPRTGDKYPASLNVFHVGAGLTAYIGMFKMSTIFYFAYQCLVQAPTLDVDEGNSLLWSVLTVAFSSAPMISTQLITSPFTSTVNVFIPPEARKNDKALRQWSENPSGDTLIEFTTLRFLPFPKRKTVRLEDLRVMQRRTGRIAQYEYLPPKLRANSQGKELGWLKALIGGRRAFYVREGAQYTKNTRGPGVWNGLVAAILKQSGYKMPEPVKLKTAPRPVSRRKPPGQMR